jgi:acylglycerol lipase
LILTGYQLGDDMRPHPAVVGALKMISFVVPSWRVIPAPDKLDKVCKDPQFKKEVSTSSHINSKKIVYPQSSHKKEQRNT